MSYKDNCKKENTPWIPPTPQEFTNAVEKALAQCRQKHRRKNRDDRYDDEEFYESENPYFPPCPTAIIPLDISPQK